MTPVDVVTPQDAVTTADAVTPEDAVDEQDSASAPPLLTVVRGAPTPEQLAALIAVVAACATGSDDEPTAAARPLWSVPVLRSPLSPGPGAWGASGLSR